MISFPIRTPLNATLTRAPPTTHTEGDENAHARWRCGAPRHDFTPADAAHLVDCKAVSREWGARQVQMDDGGLSVKRNISGRLHDVIHLPLLRWRATTARDEQSHRGLRGNARAARSSSSIRSKERRISESPTRDAKGVPLTVSGVDRGDRLLVRLRLVCYRCKGL